MLELLGLLTELGAYEVVSRYGLLPTEELDKFV